MNKPPYPDRTVWLTNDKPTSQGKFVLCWLHHALRADNNAVLETAHHYAQSLHIPLLIYAGLGGAHRYNSDRSHRFILESAQDLNKQLTALGQTLFFHLPENPNTASPIAKLGKQAALIVSELFPVPPFPKWYDNLQQRAPDTPFALVDDRCLVPMTYLDNAPTRAFKFRKAIQTKLSELISAPNTKPEQQLAAPPEWDAINTGDWQPVNWSTFKMDQSIAQCQIDHGIAPVAHTRGGTGAANKRWGNFRDNGGLKNYARRRNDAAIDGVSRLSPYLHFGCLSAIRLAQEAEQLKPEKGMSAGVNKFLDELIIWRELAHHFCHHRQDDLDTLSALPEWATETLQEHQTPSNEITTLSTLTLEQANTPSAIWNAAQQSLISQGELHNNVRMTWGKGITQWSPSPQQALERLVDLNHRYALDGCDPNSYGGLLWCLGQFDRPFPPARPRLGMIRPRSLDRHAERLDMEAYQTLVSRAADGQPKKVIVVGAGLSGLVAAWHLQQQGHQVTVVEKARGAGGRMSTRRTDNGHFDHGAQYFTARDPRFQRWVALFIEHGLVQEWTAPIGVLDENWRAAQPDTRRYTAAPGMNAICKHFADQLDVHYGQRVEGLQHSGGDWSVKIEDGQTLKANQLVLSSPAEQTLALLPATLTHLREHVSTIEMQPCWAVLLHGELQLPSNYQAAFINRGPLSWVANNHSKPGRADTPTAILHATPEWSQQHLEDEHDSVIEQLLDAYQNISGCQIPNDIKASAHRWRYALAKQPLAADESGGALWDEAYQIGICGDWCHGSRVEGAFLSGQMISSLLANTHC